MEALDLRGLVPAPVTPFTRDGEVDQPRSNGWAPGSAASRKSKAWSFSVMPAKGHFSRLTSRPRSSKAS